MLSEASEEIDLIFGLNSGPLRDCLQSGRRWFINKKKLVMDLFALRWQREFSGMTRRSSCKPKHSSNRFGLNMNFFMQCAGVFNI